MGRTPPTDHNEQVSLVSKSMVVLVVIQIVKSDLRQRCIQYMLFTSMYMHMVFVTL